MAAVFWASGGSASKFLFHSGITPFQLVQLRITVSAVLLFVWLLWRRPVLLKIDPKDVPYFLILGTLGMAAINVAYLYAISKLNVAAAILLEYLAPVFIAMHSLFFLREKISRTTLIAIVGAVSGCYLVVGAYNLSILSMNLSGILSGVGAALAFAWWSVHGEYGMRRYDPWTVLFFALLVATVIWNILHPPLQALLRPHSPSTWFWIVFVALVGTILPFGLYYEGINWIRSTRASITATLEPITAAGISYIFLNEVMEPLQMAGGALVITSVILLQVKQEVDEKAPGLVRAKLKDQRGRSS